MLILHYTQPGATKSWLAISSKTVKHRKKVSNVYTRHKWNVMNLADQLNKILTLQWKLSQNKHTYSEEQTWQRYKWQRKPWECNCRNSTTFLLSPFKYSDRTNTLQYVRNTCDQLQKQLLFYSWSLLRSQGGFVRRYDSWWVLSPRRGKMSIMYICFGPECHKAGKKGQYGKVGL